MIKDYCMLGCYVRSQSGVHSADKIDFDFGASRDIASHGDKIDCTFDFVADTVDSVEIDTIDRVEVDFVASLYAALGF